MMQRRQMAALISHVEQQIREEPHMGTVRLCVYKREAEELLALLKKEHASHQLELFEDHD